MRGSSPSQAEWSRGRSKSVRRFRRRIPATNECIAGRQSLHLTYCCVGWHVITVKAATRRGCRRAVSPLCRRWDLHSLIGPTAFSLKALARQLQARHTKHDKPLVINFTLAPHATKKYRVPGLVSLAIDGVQTGRQTMPSHPSLDISKFHAHEHGATSGRRGETFRLRLAREL